MQRHVVKPTSVIDWSTSVVAGVGVGLAGLVARSAPARRASPGACAGSAPRRAAAALRSDDPVPASRRSGGSRRRASA